ncbi:MAG TPA: beta-CASP ribonuclease aCPSF1, partial [Thermoplasmata archaeon]|nr:beta-CASP ribonuclease aCPSF1 [Thermoplasmata archaeon]
LLPLDSLDAVVITHAHLDHCGLVPVLLKYGYSGPVYCTAPSRDLMTLMLLDAIKVTNQEARRGLYDSSHVRELVNRTIPLRWGETTDIAPDMRLTLHNAGHILGSSICHFHLGDGDYNLAYSGDIKFERSWLFNPAVNRFPRLETLILEATYGGYRDIQPSRLQATDEFSDVATKVLGRGGKLIVPVFAVGRSQEVMLVLEEKMREGRIPRVPVYLDGMIFEATAIHTAYPEYLNSQLRTQIFQQGDNPFLSDIFHRVDSAQMRYGILDDKDPCIVLATSGMMSGGPVMEYFKAWSPEEKNAIMFVGYQAEGTFGRRLQRGLSEATFMDNGRQMGVAVKLEVLTIEGFSGHSDRMQLMNYVATVEPRPQRVVLNHGEENKVIDLATGLHKRFNLETRTPYNLEAVRLL